MSKKCSKSLSAGPHITDLPSHRIKVFIENQHACFKVFFTLRLLDDGTVREIYSHPYAPLTIRQRYPGVEKFCFPIVKNTEHQRVFGGGDTYTHVFILTDDIGNRLYGHCANTVFREAFVFISDKPWVTFFRELLCAFRANGPDKGMSMISYLYTVTTPPPGVIFDVKPWGLEIHRPHDYPHCLFVDTCPSLLLEVFTDRQLCQVVSCLLLEQNVIICAPDFSITSRVILAFLGILAPIGWHHILISVVTQNLINVLAAPTPFFVGIIHDQKEQINNISVESVVYVEIMNVEPFGSRVSRIMCFDSQVKHDSSRRPSDIEEKTEYKCTTIKYIKEIEVPLPRASNILTSTLRKSLKTLRITRSDNEKQSSEDMCAIFMQFYAKHLGMFGGPDFHFNNYIYKLASDPSVTPSEVVFYKQFYKSQCCEALRLFIKDKVDNVSWTNDVFCKMAIQFNREYYGSAFKGFESFFRSPNEPLMTPKSLLFSRLKTFLREKDE